MYRDLSSRLLEKTRSTWLVNFDSSSSALASLASDRVAGQSRARARDVSSGEDRARAVQTVCFR